MVIPDTLSNYNCDQKSVLPFKKVVYLIFDIQFLHKNTLLPSQ